MPVSIVVVNHAAEGWKSSDVRTAEKFLEGTSPRHFRRCEEIIQSSFSPKLLQEFHITPSANGFVWAAFHAYSNHHHLRIRPEDVWFSILTQLSFFINAHSEDLRAFFVSHDGKKTLEVVQTGFADFAAMAESMTWLIAENVNDPELRTWIMPSFSTTTDCDRVVGATLFMGAMQKYFTFELSLDCGIPSVTLLGEVDDWKDILQRLDKLELLGEEPKMLAAMLRPILRSMVLCFEDSSSAEVTSFWNTIVHKEELGSGTDYFTGWLTAFCFWDEKGKAKRLTQRQFGNVLFPSVDINDVPDGIASVPVNVDDNGRKFIATLVAGSVGIIGTPSRRGSPRSVVDISTEEAPFGTVGASLDTVQPLSGWWAYATESAAAEESRKAEIEQLEGEMKRLREEMQTITDGRREKWALLTQSVELYRRVEELRAY